MKRRFIVAVTAVVALAVLPAGAQENHGLGTSGFVQQRNLVSNVPGRAEHTDPNLVNAWGISSSATSPFWVADNGTGVSTLYNGSGNAVPLVVTIAGGAPTGTVFNPTNDFVVSSGGKSGRSFFIFDGETGIISGWNPNVDSTHSVVAVDNSASGAVYKGLAIGSNASGNFLYAANFHAGTVDVFDGSFHPAGSFTDPSVPAGFAPFGIQNIGGNLYVTYAKQDAARHGNLIRRVASGVPLNSPWGLAIAPSTWGRLAGDLLVGNFGDGAINVFDPVTGDWRGGLKTETGEPLRIDGLWGLRYGNGGSGGDPNTLFFTAGPDDEANGLFGSLTQVHPVEDNG